MAYYGKLSQLIEQLVTSETGIKPQTDTSTFQSLQRHALTILKNTSSVRTNQFEISERLEGLVEKFRVLNNDELADALQVRLQELETTPSKRIPEILSLLLHLSDNPAQEFRIEKLDRVERPLTPAPLTWADVFAEDPLDNHEGIWDTVDYADESSEDGIVTPELVSGSEDKGSVGSQEEDESFSLQDVGGLESDFASLDAITGAQFWREDYNDNEASGDNDAQVYGQPVTYITETQVVREVLFMLLGLPSTMYSLDVHGYSIASTRYGITRASIDALQNVLKCFAFLGDQLKLIRVYVKGAETVALVQSFQAILAMRLRDVDSLITKIQDRILNPCKGETVTLLSTLKDMLTAARPLCKVAETVVFRCRKEKGNPFIILEELYDIVVSSEAIGDVNTYQFAAKMFFHCFNVYLKPIRAWMETGKLKEGDHTIFVYKKPQALPLASLWTDQYVLSCDHEEHFHAPRFLHLEAEKMFKIGKSVIFLERLGQALDYEQEVPSPEPPLNYSTVCPPSTQGLCPFTDLFSMALNEWITNKHHSSSMRLRKVLGEHCGLWSSFDALDCIYFSPDGAIRSQMASSIFRRIDEGRGIWNDRFILSGIFHETLSKIDYVDTRRLTVRSASENSTSEQTNQRSVKALTSVLINYTLPWAVANIIKTESLVTYQHVFVLLLQVERAQQLLYQRSLPKETTQSAKDHEDIHHLIFSLRHRLLWLVTTLQTYLTTIVLPQSSADMRRKMQRAEDLEEMIEIHQTYILHLRDQCFLSERLASTHQAIISILDLMVLFSDICASYASKIIARTQPNIAKPDSSTHQVLRPQRRKCTGASLFKDTDGEETSGTLKKQHAHEADTSHLLRLRKLSMTFTELLDFVQAGLQEAIRTGKEPCWEILADDLGLGRSQDGR